MLFKDDLWYLSNFFPSKIIWRGTTWPTVEHAFQAAKCSHPEDEEDIRNANTPGIAKRLGRRVLLRPDWEEIKVDMMIDLVQMKFKQSEELCYKLMDTKGYLEEGNYWHDNYWGNCYCEKCKDIEGLNVLGTILTMIRNDLMSRLEYELKKVNNVVGASDPER